MLCIGSYQMDMGGKNSSLHTFFLSFFDFQGKSLQNNLIRRICYGLHLLPPPTKSGHFIKICSQPTKKQTCKLDVTNWGPIFFNWRCSLLFPDPVCRSQSTSAATTSSTLTPKKIGAVFAEATAAPARPWRDSSTSLYPEEVRKKQKKQAP